MIDQQSVDLPFTFGHIFVFKVSHLPRDSSNTEKASLRGQSTTDRPLAYDGTRHRPAQVIPRLTNNLKGAQTVNPTSQTVEYRHKHPQAIRNNRRISFLRHENSIVNAGSKWNKHRGKDLRDCKTPYMIFVSIGPTQRLAGVRCQNGRWRNQNMMTFPI